MLLALLLAVAPEVTAPVIKTITVPPELAKITSPPELSGLVWSAALNRYIVVSDDTGLDSLGTNHLPIVFTLSRDGALDPTPIELQGVDKLNDAESICAGPNGTYFVLTSHSPNREGKRPMARRQLLHLALESRRLKVLGRADLMQLDGGELLTQLGLEATSFDLEAVAFHDDALYLGLKGPQTDKGEAVIAKLSDPVKQLASGRIAAKTLSRWKAARLCISDHVCEGVTDLLFTSTGLLLVANAAKGAPSDHGGALWRWNEGQPPELLYHFDGLKPEGLALEGDEAVILFDRDRDPPQWVRFKVRTPNR